MMDNDCSTWALRMAARVGRVTGFIWGLLVFLAWFSYAVAREWALWH